MTRSYIVIYHAMFSPTAPTVHSLIICWFASLLFSAFGLILEEENEPNYLNAGVGEYEVFNCDLDFPHETPIPYILQWNRDVSATTLISKYRRFHLVGFISPYEIRTTRTETILLNFDKQYYSSQDAKTSTCLSVTWFVVTRGRWNLDSSKCIDTGIARYRSWSFKEIDSSSQGDNLYSRYNDSWSSCNLIKIIETRRLIYVSSLRPDPVILTRCKVEKTRSTSINPSNRDYVYQRTVCAYVQPRRKVLARGRFGFFKKCIRSVWEARYSFSWLWVSISRHRAIFRGYDVNAVAFAQFCVAIFPSCVNPLDRQTFLTSIL